MRTAIRVESLAKRFRVNHAEQRRADYRTLRETLASAIASPLRNLRSGAALGKVEDFWALRNVDLEVSQGEVVGIIGRNGAGKSTLLKILTRITDPTRGRALIWGRVGSLLEVGTGFHPELTGRENVLLNGSILGMKRQEVLANFDRIVDFAGVERFIDTPIKRYSSGMKVRLAFAVAAHLDLEIMLVDEVLAVGDAEFQRKCLGRMSDVAQSGRTVLFVSHSMPAVQGLCPRTVLMDAGQIVQDGATEEVVNCYLKEFDQNPALRDVAEIVADRRGTGEARLQSIEFRSTDGHRASSIMMGEGLVVRAVIKAFEEVRQVFLSFTITDGSNQTLCQVDGQQSQNWHVNLEAGECKAIDCRLPQLNVAPGRYSLSAWIHLVAGRQLVDFLPRIVSFDVQPGDVFGTGQLPKGKYVFCQPSHWATATEWHG